MLRSHGRIALSIALVGLVATVAHASEIRTERVSEQPAAAAPPVVVRVDSARPMVAMTMDLQLVSIDRLSIDSVRSSTDRAALHDTVGSPIAVVELPKALRFPPADSARRRSSQFTSAVLPFGIGLRLRTVAWAVRHPLYAASWVFRGKAYSDNRV